MSNRVKHAALTFNKSLFLGKHIGELLSQSKSLAELSSAMTVQRWKLRTSSLEMFVDNLSKEESVKWV